MYSFERFAQISHSVDEQTQINNDNQNEINLLKQDMKDLI